MDKPRDQVGLKEGYSTLKKVYIYREAQPHLDTRLKQVRSAVAKEKKSSLEVEEEEPKSKFSKEVFLSCISRVCEAKSCKRSKFYISCRGSKLQGRNFVARVKVAVVV